MRFPAKKYLNHYYSTIGTENDKLMAFHARVSYRIPRDAVHLEIGSGPTIYQLISLAPNVSKIIHTDASIGALRQIKKWIHNDNDAFNWENYFQRVIELENGNFTKEEVEKRIKILRNTEVKLLKRDLSSAQVFKKIGKVHGNFQSISSNFALEAIVYKKEDFRELLHEIYQILDKGGVFTIIMVESCKEYQIGKIYLKTLDITRNELLDILIQTGFKKDHIISDYEKTENEDFGYKGIMFYSCIK